MLSIALVLLAHAPAVSSGARPLPLELTNNTPFVQVSVDGSAPQTFILDTGNNGGSIVARECADRLGLASGAEAKADIGAGAGADVRTSQASQAVLLKALGDTLTVAQPMLLTLAHVARGEGRRVDGLLGSDFMSRHVVQIDYAARTITVHDSTPFPIPPGAAVVPLDLETGWAIAEFMVTPQGGKAIPCRVIVDTGMRGTITLFRPFSTKHGLFDSPGTLPHMVTGTGAGGITRGDVGRLDALSIGSLTFDRPVAVFSRDTTGVLASEYPEGIAGGEILRRHRVTFDYPHGRMILEPYAKAESTFEYDMSGLFLTADSPAFEKIRVVSVNPGTPAAAAGLRTDDEIVSIDGQRTPKMSLDQARQRLRTPGARRLEIRRHGQTMNLRLEARRLI